MSFYLFGHPDEKLRLKAFSGNARDGKMLLKIEIEAADVFHFGYALAELAEVKKGQSAKPERAKKPRAAPQTPALPAPSRALPKA